MRTFFFLTLFSFTLQISPVSADGPVTQPGAPVCLFCVPDDKWAISKLPGGYYAKSTQGTMLRQGYSLMIPNNHVRAFSDLSPQEYQKYLRSRELYLAALKKAYGKPPVIFEYGEVGQSVQHAHLHALPWGIGPHYLEAQTEKLLKEAGVKVIKKTDIEAGREHLNLSQFRKEYGGYLFISQPHDKASGIIYGVKPDSQNPVLKMILRKAMANIVGSPALADWRASRATPELIAEDDAIRRETTKKLNTALRDLKSRSIFDGGVKRQNAWAVMLKAIEREDYPRVADPQAYFKTGLKSESPLPENWHFADMKKGGDWVSVLAIERPDAESLRFRYHKTDRWGQTKLWEAATLNKEGFLMGYERGNAFSKPILFWTHEAAWHRSIAKQAARWTGNLVQRFIRLTPKI